MTHRQLDRAPASLYLSDMGQLSSIRQQKAPPSIMASAFFLFAHQFFLLKIFSEIPKKQNCYKLKIRSRANNFFHTPLEHKRRSHKPLRVFAADHQSAGRRWGEIPVFTSHTLGSLWFCTLHGCTICARGSRRISLPFTSN